MSSFKHKQKGTNYNVIIARLSRVSVRKLILKGESAAKKYFVSASEASVESVFIVLQRRQPGQAKNAKSNFVLIGKIYTSPVWFIRISSTVKWKAPIALEHTEINR